MTVIILSSTDGNKTPYDLWFPNAKENIILLSSRKEHTFNSQHFLLIEAFENYMDNVEVETKAIQLSKSTISQMYYPYRNLTLYGVRG